MNYDLMTTLCGVFVAVSGVIMLDDQNAFSPRVQLIAKCVNIAAIAVGMYFTNKSARTKPAPAAPLPAAEESVPNAPES